MPDAPKTAKVSLKNSGEGPRSFFDAKREQHILRPGDSWEGEVLEADKADLSADLTGGGGSASSSSKAAAKPKASPKIEFKSLDGLDRDGLITTAREEGFTSIADQPELSEDEIRKAIVLARDSVVAEIGAEAKALEKANTAEQLRTIAGDEKVEVEGDDNKPDLAFKIAYARYLAKAGS